MGDGPITTEDMRFTAWVRMAPTTHTPPAQEFHHMYCSAPCYRRGDHMPSNCMVIVASALVGFRAVVSALVHEGCSVLWVDTMCANGYDRRGAVMWWRIVQDMDVPI